MADPLSFEALSRGLAPHPDEGGAGDGSAEVAEDVEESGDGAPAAKKQRT